MPMLTRGAEATARGQHSDACCYLMRRGEHRWGTLEDAPAGGGAAPPGPPPPAAPTRPPDALRAVSAGCPPPHGRGLRLLPPSHAGAGGGARAEREDPRRLRGG